MPLMFCYKYSGHYVPEDYGYLMTFFKSISYIKSIDILVVLEEIFELKPSTKNIFLPNKDMAHWFL